jgi:hypothetical protein
LFPGPWSTLPAWGRASPVTTSSAHDKSRPREDVMPGFDAHSGTRMRPVLTGRGYVGRSPIGPARHVCRAVIILALSGTCADAQMEIQGLTVGYTGPLRINPLSALRAQYLCLTPKGFFPLSPATLVGDDKIQGLSGASAEPRPPSAQTRAVHRRQGTIPEASPVALLELRKIRLWGPAEWCSAATSASLPESPRKRLSGRSVGLAKSKWTAAWLWEKSLTRNMSRWHLPPARRQNDSEKSQDSADMSMRRNAALPHDSDSI